MSRFDISVYVVKLDCRINSEAAHIIRVHSATVHVQKSAQLFQYVYMYK